MKVFDASIIFIIIIVLQQGGKCKALAISSKLDLSSEEKESASKNDSITSDVEDESLELKQTIIVTTKLKNSNRNTNGAAGFRRNLKDRTSTLLKDTYNDNNKNRNKSSESDDVPVIKGYKALETTFIRPKYHNDYDPNFLRESGFVTPVIYKDSYEDIYPSQLEISSQWRPSNLYNNIHTWRRSEEFVPYNIGLPDPGTMSRSGSLTKYQKNIINSEENNIILANLLNNCRSFKTTTSNYYRTTPRNPWLRGVTKRMTIDGKLIKPFKS